MHHLPVRAPTIGRQSSANRDTTQSLLAAEEGQPLAADGRHRHTPSDARAPGGGASGGGSAHGESAGPVEHFALEAEVRREQWEAMADLDTFFARVYSYFRERGLRCMLLSRVVSVLMLLFTVSASYCAAELIDWHGLLYLCRDERSCLELQLLRPEHRPSWLMRLCLGLFAVYLGWQLLHLSVELRSLLEIRRFYELELQLDDEQLQRLSWDEVVQRLVLSQRTSKFVIVKAELSAHDVAMRVLRKENWLVALLDSELLPLQLLGSRPALPQTLQWALSASLLDCMYDGQLRLRPDFLNDPAALRRRFRVQGLLSLSLLPFAAIFMAVFFFLRHAEELHRQPGSVGARAFTPYALWRMRGYNELPHLLEARARAAYPAACCYVKAFPSRELAIVARLVTFVCGSMAAAALAVSLLNPEVALHCQAAGRNLLWYLALASGALAVSRAFAVDGEAEAAAQPELWLARLLCVAQLPGGEALLARARERETLGQVCALFEYKLVSFVRELLSCLSTPYALCVSLSEAAERILEFIRRSSCHVEGLGDVCACATFALPPPEPGGPAQPALLPGSGADAAAAAACANRGGRLQRSLLSFSAAHPHWLPPAWQQHGCPAAWLPPHCAQPGARPGLQLPPGCGYGGSQGSHAEGSHAGGSHAGGSHAEGSASGCGWQRSAQLSAHPAAGSNLGAGSASNLLMAQLEQGRAAADAAAAVGQAQGQGQGQGLLLMLPPGAQRCGCGAHGQGQGQGPGQLQLSQQLGLGWGHAGGGCGSALSAYGAGHGGCGFPCGCGYGCASSFIGQPPPHPALAASMAASMAAYGMAAGADAHESGQSGLGHSHSHGCLHTFHPPPSPGPGQGLGQGLGQGGHRSTVLRAVSELPPSEAADAEAARPQPRSLAASPEPEPQGAGPGLRPRPARELPLPAPGLGQGPGRGEQPEPWRGAAVAADPAEGAAAAGPAGAAQHPLE